MLEAALHMFASQFVVHEFRDRFVHEATRQPAKLRARICHETDRVIPARFKNGVAHGAPGETWLLLESDGFRATTWEEVSERMRAGSGMLALSSSGDRFYAESEDSSGMEVWAA
jgi:hypothetical protein